MPPPSTPPTASASRVSSRREPSRRRCAPPGGVVHVDQPGLMSNSLTRSSSASRRRRCRTRRNKRRCRRAYRPPSSGFLRAELHRGSMFAPTPRFPGGGIGRAGHHPGEPTAALTGPPPPSSPRARGPAQLPDSTPATASPTPRKRAAAARSVSPMQPPRHRGARGGQLDNASPYCTASGASIRAHVNSSSAARCGPTSGAAGCLLRLRRRAQRSEREPQPGVVGHQHHVAVQQDRGPESHRRTVHGRHEGLAEGGQRVDQLVERRTELTSAPSRDRSSRSTPLQNARP